MHYIYKIENLQNHRTYIDYTDNLVKMRNRVFTDLMRGSLPFTSLQTDYNKFGKNNFIFQIILRTNTSEIEKEKNYYITYYRTNVALYGYNAATILPAIDDVTDSDALDILAALEFRGGRDAGDTAKQIQRFYGIRAVTPYLNKHFPRAKAEYSQMSRDDRYLYYQIFCDSINYYNMYAQKNCSVFI